MSFEEIKGSLFDLMTQGQYKEKISGKLLEIDEAICWVAFDAFQMPPLGPREGHEFLVHVDYGEWLETEGEKAEQAFKIAREQVFNSIENGLIAAIGKEAERDMGDPRGEHVPLFTLVTPQMFSDGGWNEAGRAYQIGETVFDGLFVKYDDLVRVFSPFKKARGADNSEALETPRDVMKTSLELQPTRKGRPRKYDWDRVLSEVAFEIGKSGEMPESQAELAELISECFMRNYGDEPANSGVRGKASWLLEMLRQKSQ